MEKRKTESRSEKRTMEKRKTGSFSANRTMDEINLKKTEADAVSNYSPADDFSFLPISRKDMEARGIKQLDFVYITGDAYVDHPSFGAAIICRLIESSRIHRRNNSSAGLAFSIGFYTSGKTETRVYGLLRKYRLYGKSLYSR